MVGHTFFGWELQSVHRNAVWIGFLLIVVAVSLWFIVKAGYDVMAYFQLNTQVEAKIEKWNIEEKKADQFVVQAYYFFEYQGKDYQGMAYVGSKYPNPWAANRAAHKFSEQSWSVWINPSHPEKAVIEKHFPYKTTISAVILLGLTLYFFFLGMYVGVKRG